MKKAFYLFLFLLFFVSVNKLAATTYLYFWVNGDTAHVLTQGDLYAWEFDIQTPGSTVSVELYLDLDVSRTITAADLLLQRFEMTDGDLESDGPRDSSSVPDGILYVGFGPFGFAPQNYLLRVLDTDESTVTSWFAINAMSTPAAQIRGNVFIEGLAAPDDLYENVMINAFGQGMFSGLTDNQGAYTINLPAADSIWRIEAIFYPNLSDYLLSTDTYETQVPASGIDDIDFYFTRATAWIYGDLVDQDGLPALIDTWIGCENTTLNESHYGEVQAGHYLFPLHVVPQGSDSTNSFRLNIDSRAFSPEYMSPQLGMEFSVKYGDSLEQDILVYSTNSIIYGYVHEQSGPPSGSYQFFASSDSFGQAFTMSSADDGYFELSVRTGDNYQVGLNDDPDYGTPLPEGYIISDGNWKPAQPGDTLYFNLVPAQSALRGSISFDPGDPVNFNFDRNWITAYDIQYNYYRTRVHQDYSYNLPVANGIYQIFVELSGEISYLAKPIYYSTVTVENDTLDTLNFLLNHAHARLTVKLINAPVPEWWSFYSIQTQGEYPDVYYAARQMEEDSTFEFNICEGNWVLNPPIYDSNYDVFPADILLPVSEQDSSFYVEFVYQLRTGVAEQNIIPRQAYLSQNYPNPFNPSTHFVYGLPQSGKVKLTVYNILGEEIAVLVDSWQQAGVHKISWRAENLASGIYLYRLETGQLQFTKKLVLLR